MKKYRSLAPIIMVFIMIISWYMLISDAATTHKEYNSYLGKARSYAADGLTKYAIDNYTKALDIKSSPEIYREVADYYKNQNRFSDYMDWCEEFMEKYPKNALAYECLLDAYLMDKDYEDCYTLLNKAEDRNISSDYIEQVRKDIKYIYKLDFNAYDDISVYSNNFCAVNSDGYWGFVDRYGKLRISTAYTSAGAYNQSGFAPVVNKDGEAYYIDKSAERVIVTKGAYVKLGVMLNDVLAAKRPDGKYEYVNSGLKVLFGEYDYASTINGGVAAVQNNGSWMIINNSGKQIGSETYLDVILDEKEIACRNDRLFVSKEAGKYILVDTSCKQVGSLVFEDANVFMGGDYAAVKIDGAWKFINKDGKLISDKTYTEAKSFAISDTRAVTTSERTVEATQGTT